MLPFTHHHTGIQQWKNESILASNFAVNS